MEFDISGTDLEEGCHNMRTSLAERRLKAAEASKGISSNVIYELILRLIKDSDCQGDLLEYGAGIGSLIKRLLDCQYQGTVTGTDILPRPPSLPQTVHWLETDLNKPIESESESFDVIISTEVIEHLENPRALFREFYRLLRPGGTLILSTPNQESIRSLLSLILFGHFVAFLETNYPAHITALLKKDLERICLETGFSRPDVYYVPFGGVPKLPQINWQRVSFGILKGRLFSDNLAIVTKRLEEA